MNNLTIEDLLLFVERNGYENRSFKYVINQFAEELTDCYNSMQPHDNETEINIIIHI